MSNDYFNHTVRLARATLARSAAVNAIADSIAAGFEKLPDELVLNHGRVTFATDTGAANAYVAAMPQTWLAYADGATIYLKIGAGNTNTGAATLNVDGLGARAIKTFAGAAPAADALEAGKTYALVYDSANTRFLMMSFASQDTVNIATVSGNIADVNTVAGISADVSTVAGISANVTAVAGNATNINTVAGIAANVTTVAGISADVTTVAGISANVTTVAGISADVATVASIAADVAAVAASGADYIQPDQHATLTAGYDSDAEPLGTITSGTVTPEVDANTKENFKTLTANGAFTLAPPSTSSNCTILIHVTNGASAGAITTTGYVVDPNGDTYETTNANEYIFQIIKIGTVSLLTVKALQ